MNLANQNKNIMNSEEFVSAIKATVLQSSIDSTKELLEHPPGRSPSSELKEMSEWYNNLNTVEKQVVNNIIAESARGAVFGFLCVLDGVRAIEDKDKGTLKLYYERRSESILLNDQSQFGLHELL